MCGGFHGKYELAFDVGKFFELSHHQVIPCAVIADGKGFLDNLALEVMTVTSWLRLATSIPTINICFHPKQ